MIVSLSCYVVLIRVTLVFVDQVELYLVVLCSCCACVLRIPLFSPMDCGDNTPYSAVDLQLREKRGMRQRPNHYVIHVIKRGRMDGRMDRRTDNKQDTRKE